MCLSETSSSLHMTAQNCAFGRCGRKDWYQKTWRKLLHEKKIENVARTGRETRESEKKKKVIFQYSF